MSNRVLIVEDSASLALTCKLHLAGQGHTLLEAADGQTALALLHDQSVDCILLDLDLPDMNGAEILRLVRDFPTPPVVVVVTARSAAPQAEHAVAYGGAFDYLVKPFNGPRLVTTVRNALTEAALRRELANRQAEAPGVSLHHYDVRVTWTGNRGTGTSGYRDYARDHLIEADGRQPIAGSSDPAFRGNPTRWNPEQLLVAAVSACHKLWYLHLCAEAGVVVLDYVDDALGTMAEDSSGSGHFTRVTLRPVVTIRAGCDTAVAAILHTSAHDKCFIANSLNFPIRCEPRIVTRSEG